MPPNHPLNKSAGVICVAILLLSISWKTMGQRVNPELLNVAGFSVQTPEYMGFMSLGEVAITTLNGPGGIITQGFLQPEIDKPCSDFNLQYYPNPVSEEITVIDEICGRRIVKISVYDVNGRWVNTYNLVNRMANLELLTPGVFIVRAYGFNDEFLGAFKIIKSGMLRG